MKNRPELPKMPYGEGSFSYYKNKIYYRKRLKLEDGTYENVGIYGDTVKECLTKMKEKEKSFNKTTALPQSKEILSDAMLNWADTVKKPTLKIQSYTRLISTINNQIEKYSIGHSRYQSITTDEIQEHIDYLVKQNYSFSVIKKTYDALNDFYRYSSIKNKFDNPMLLVVIPKKENLKKDAKGELKFFDDEDIEKFIEECGKTWNTGSPRYQGGFVFGSNIYLGLRIGELLALQWKDVDLEQNTLSVTKTLIEVQDYETHKTEFIVQSTNKTSINRFVPINSKAKELLLKHKEVCSFTEPDNYVISTRTGKTTTTKNASDTIKTIQQNAKTKVQDGGTHVLRHTCASLYFRKGISIEIIAKILGHSVEVCRNTYLHFVEEQLKDAASKINLD